MTDDPKTPLGPDEPPGEPPPDAGQAKGGESSERGQPEAAGSETRPGDPTPPPQAPSNNAKPRPIRRVPRPRRTRTRNYPPSIDGPSAPPTADASPVSAAGDPQPPEPAPPPELPLPPQEEPAVLGAHQPQPDPAQASGLALPRVQIEDVGAAPGIEHQQLAQMPSLPGDVYITCIDYSPQRVQIRQIDDLEDFILHHRPDWSAVRWINMDGLTDMRIIQALAEKYELHPLALEDLIQVHQRPKVDTYGGEGGAGMKARLFIVVRMIEMLGERPHSEQISMFLGHTTLLTFQETHGDVWDPIRARLQKAGSRLRNNDASFLAYALLDAIVDYCFPILEHYADRLEKLEDHVIARPDRETFTQIHALKRELLLLRREVWPMRDVVQVLQREPHECMGEMARTYMRDVYDHLMQIIDLIETYREVANGLEETYLGQMSVRMNEIIKVLTVVATIFTPPTFLASVYGMNFKHFPELNWAFGYPMFWAICLSMTAFMLLWFRKRGWL